MINILNALISLYFTIYVGGTNSITSLYTPGFLIGGEVAIFTPDSFSRYIMGLSTSFYSFRSPYYEFYRREYEINIMPASANLSALRLGYSRDFVMQSRRWGWELSGGIALVSYDLTFPEADVNLGGTIVPLWGGGPWLGVKFHRWERKRKHVKIPLQLRILREQPESWVHSSKNMTNFFMSKKLNVIYYLQNF